MPGIYVLSHFNTPVFIISQLTKTGTTKTKNMFYSSTFSLIFIYKFILIYNTLPFIT
jgi:hypothetical protein